MSQNPRPLSSPPFILPVASAPGSDRHPLVRSFPRDLPLHRHLPAWESLSASPVQDASGDGRISALQHLGSVPSIGITDPAFTVSARMQDLWKDAALPDSLWDSDLSPVQALQVLRGLLSAGFLHGWRFTRSCAGAAAVQSLSRVHPSLAAACIDAWTVCQQISELGFERFVIPDFEIPRLSLAQRIEFVAWSLRTPLELLHVRDFRIPKDALASLDRTSLLRLLDRADASGMHKWSRWSGDIRDRLHRPQRP